MAGRSARRSSAGTEFVETIQSLYRYRKILVPVLLILAVLLGVYIRMAPALSAGRIELHAYDPWIEYWLTEYIHKHGVTSWFELSRGNPDTHLFWYPWGRDFTYTEFPGIPVFASITYPLVSPLGLSLKTWVALQPVLAGALAIIAAYLLGRELTGEVGGLAAAYTIAAVSAAVDRTVVGFVEKEGFAAPLLILQALFLVRMVKHCRASDAVLAGLLTGLIGLVWGGVYIAVGLAALYLALLPLLNVELKIEHIYAFTGFTATTILALILSPKLAWTRIEVFWILVPAAGFVLSLIGYRLNRIQYIILLSIIAVGVIAAAYTGHLPMGGRILAAIGLRREAGALVQSVAEHKSLWDEGLGNMINTLMNNLSPAFLLGAAYSVYMLLYKRNPYHGLIAAAALITLYAYTNMAYFAQSAGLYNALAASLAVGMVSSRGFEGILGSRQGRTKRKRRAVSTGLSEAAYIAIILVVLIAANTAYAAYKSYDTESRNLPQIIAGGVGLGKINMAWPMALEYMRENISSDAVVVAWWDYGYWISVAGHRASLADGATMNSTQIKMLGDLLTSDENHASEILRKLNLVPGKTYILFYDMFVMEYNETQGFARIYPVNGIGGIDLVKAYWMLAIPGKIDHAKIQDLLPRLSAVASDYRRRHGEPIPYERLRETTVYKELEAAMSPYMTIYYDPNNGGMRLGLNFSNAENILILGLLSQAVYETTYASLLGAKNAQLNNTWVGDAVPGNISQVVLMASDPSNYNVLRYVNPVIYRHFTIERVFTDTIGHYTDTRRGVEVKSFIAVFMAKWIG